MDTIVQIFAILGGLATVVLLVITLLHGRQIILWRKKLTWDDSLRIAAKLLRDIEKANWTPDVIVGLGRSGGIWGGWIAGNLGTLPFGVVDDKYNDDKFPEVEFPGGAEALDALRKTYPNMKRMLVVEGASSRGGTINRFRAEFGKKLEGIELKFAVLYMNPASDARIDYIGKVGPEPWPHKFPWHFKDRYRPYLRDLFSSATVQRNASSHSEQSS